MQNPYDVVLKPSEPHEEGEITDAQREILSDSAPEGRYYFSVVLDVKGKQLELTAGEAEINYGLNGIDFKVQTEIIGSSPRVVDATLMATNTTDKRVQIRYNGCPFWLVVYDNPERSGIPVWDEEKRPNPNPHTGAHWGCFSRYDGLELAPGETGVSRWSRKAWPEPDVMGHPLLGDKALKDGRYYFSARVEVNDTTIEVKDAGEADLSQNQKPLPNERTVDGVTYGVETEVVQRGYPYLQATLTISNNTNDARDTTLNLQCPVSISSALDPKHREPPYIYAIWKPDWSPQQKDCDPKRTAINLMPGESKRYIQEYLVRASLHEERIGHHYLVAHVYTDENVFALSAGDLDLHY